MRPTAVVATIPEPHHAVPAYRTSIVGQEISDGCRPRTGTHWITPGTLCGTRIWDTIGCKSRGCFARPCMGAYQMLRTADRRRYRKPRIALALLLLAPAFLLSFACRANSNRDRRTSEAAQAAEAAPPAPEFATVPKLAPNPKLAPGSKPGRVQPAAHFLQQEVESMAREDQGRAAEALEQEAKDAPRQNPRRSPLRPTRRPVPTRRRP